MSAHFYYYYVLLGMHCDVHQSSLCIYVYVTCIFITVEFTLSARF
jgi:hypothetical protein